MAEEFVVRKLKKSSQAAGVLIGFIEGHNKSQETHPFSEEDMVEFAEWIANSKLHGYSKQLYEAMIRHKVNSTKELIQIWKQQKIKTIYYDKN